jgi:hypothetical protein
MNHEELARRFRHFGLHESGTSPLYAELCLAVAEQPDVLALLAVAEDLQQRPNLLFAAVQDLLLAGADHPLRAFYPSVGGQRPPQGAGRVFADFCHVHADALRGLIATRTTQTNEVRRCVALAPVLTLVQSWAAPRPLALLEVGCSAGLNLQVARYRCDYHPGDASLGPADARVRLATELRGGTPPEGPPLRVGARLGLDLHPLDVRDEGDVRWLRACVWPEHEERRRLLDLAVAEARRDPPALVQGDAVDDLAAAVARLPADAVPVVVHSATLVYLTSERRAAFETGLTRLAHDRDLARVSLEWDESAAPVTFALGLTRFRDGERHDRLLGSAEPHGHWLNWSG